MSVAGQRDLLAAVLDVLIPAEAEFPAAGAIVLDHVLSTAAASSELDALLTVVLRAVAEAGRGGDFSTLAVDEREAVLREVERAHPDAFDALVGHTYAGYYSRPDVVTRLGLTPGPVHPRGHRIAPAELPDLTRVTSRGALYRRA